MALKRIRGGPLAAGAVAGPLSVGILTVLGARGAGYDARRQTVSSLDLGQAGWLRRANSVIAGSPLWKDHTDYERHLD